MAANHVSIENKKYQQPTIRAHWLKIVKDKIKIYTCINMSVN